MGPKWEDGFRWLSQASECCYNISIKTRLRRLSDAGFPVDEVLDDIFRMQLYD